MNNLLSLWCNVEPEVEGVPGRLRAMWLFYHGGWPGLEPCSLLSQGLEQLQFWRAPSLPTSTGSLAGHWKCIAKQCQGVWDRALVSSSIVCVCLGPHGAVSVYASLSAACPLRGSSNSSWLRYVQKQSPLHRGYSAECQRNASAEKRQ